MKEFVLFDLDGTLTDPQEGIARSMQYAVSRRGIKADNLEELANQIGPPIAETFSGYFGISQDMIAQTIADYRDFFAREGILGNKLYDGILPLMRRMQSAHKVLAVATSKVDIFAEKVLKMFGLRQYFSVVAGSLWDGTRDKKGDVIRYALTCLENPPLESVIMVGDRKYDIIGAHQAGIDSVGVLYGFGSRKELEEAGATHIVSTPTALGDLLLSQSV